MNELIGLASIARNIGLRKVVCRSYFFKLDYDAMKTQNRVDNRSRDIGVVQF